MIDTREEFSNVTFQHPASPSVILADLPKLALETLHSFMRALPNLPRIRISDKMLSKNLVELAMDGVVEQPVAYASFMDLARLRVVQGKG